MPILPSETWVYSIPPNDTAELELDRPLILKNVSLQAKVTDEKDRTALEVSYTPVGSESPKSAVLATFFKHRTDSVNLHFKVYPGRVYCFTVIGKNALDLIGDLPEHVDLAAPPVDVKPVVVNSKDKPKPKPRKTTRQKADQDKAAAEADSDTAGEAETTKSKGKAPARLRRTESTGSITRAQSKMAAKLKPSSNDSEEESVAGPSGAKRVASSAEAAAKKRKLNVFGGANSTPEPTATGSKQAGGIRTKVKV
ncbi:hypothetical protein MD484_g8073, partial [Candolleomyces efflorescens]